MGTPPPRKKGPVRCTISITSRKVHAAAARRARREGRSFSSYINQLVKADISAAEIARESAKPKAKGYVEAEQPELLPAA